MIVRISTEGQYEIPDEDADKLNELDNDAVAAVEAGDEERFHDALSTRCSTSCAAKARPVADDVLEESDVILPPPDLTFAEAGEAVHGRRPHPRLTRTSG